MAATATADDLQHAGKDEDDERDLQHRADKVIFLMTFVCPCAAIFTCCQVGISGEVVRNCLVAVLVATLRVRFIHIYYY